MQRLALAIYRALHVLPLVRLWILRIVNTRFMVGAVAVIVDGAIVQAAIFGTVAPIHHAHRAATALARPEVAA